MQDGIKLLQLAFGLCLVNCYVDAVAIKLFGGGLFNPNEDMMPKLEQQKEEKLRLETQLQNAKNANEKTNIEKELQKVNDAIANMESTYKMTYKEHLEEVAELTENFEREKENLRMKKEIFEYALEIKSLEALEERNKKSLEQIGKFEERLAKLEEDLKMISDPIQTYRKLIQKQKQDMEQEREKLKQEGKEIAKKIEDAQDRALNSRRASSSQ